MFVYLITHRATGKGYVGQTSLSVPRRFDGHVHASRSASKRRTSAIAAAIRKHGAAAFEVRELEACSTLKALNDAEVAWIAALGTLAPAGYNIRFGGLGGGPMTPETKARLSASKRGRKQSRDVIERRAAALRGRKRPEAFKAHLSKLLTGRKHNHGPKVSAARLALGLKMDRAQAATFVATGHAAQARLRAAGSLSFHGERNPNRKLSWPIVREIRARWAEGGASQEALAGDYGVRQTAISRIVRNVAWIE